MFRPKRRVRANLGAILLLGVLAAAFHVPPFRLDAGADNLANGAAARDNGPIDAPAWSRGREELFYRLTFLGVTAGYARFTIMGKTIVDGRPTYHLHVRGWTSAFLSVFYPVNNIMDYYLDVQTLEPVRIAVTKTEKKQFKDQVILYDQDKGVITYWDKGLTRMEKRVEVMPNVHDPVTAVYYFRTKDTGNPDRPRNMYAGRKMWQVASRSNGLETIPDEQGRPVETIVLRPVLKRDGKPESKGDIKMWLTNDERRVPIRIYADIKFGTVVGQLIPSQEGG